MYDKVEEKFERSRINEETVKEERKENWRNG